jgi:hypothetical protein
MGGLLRLVRDHKRDRDEEVALSERSTADVIVEYARSLAGLTPKVDHAAFVAITRTLAVLMSHGPPDCWPGEAVALLRDCGLGEFSEDDLRRLKSGKAYREFEDLFHTRPRPSELAADPAEYAESIYRQRALMIEAGAG